MATWSGGLNGIDVSSNQPDNVVTDVSYDFIIIKISGATYGGSFENQGFTKFSNVPSSARKGVYHFAGGGNPEDEALYFVTQLNKIDTSKTALFLDWESMDDTGVSGSNKTFGTSEASEWISRFLAFVKEKTGKSMGVYMSASAQSQLPSDIGTSQRWIAQYPDYNTISGFPDSVWTDGTYEQPAVYQFTSSLSLSGYSGRLDGDKLYNIEAWDALAGGSIIPTPTPTPTNFHKSKIWMWIRYHY